MTKEEQDKLKLLYDKVCELEVEMSVSSKNNKYIEDIKKSSKLLLYRYALLVQIKDIRKKRGKIEDRISRINQLQNQSMRGRLLTERELQAIHEIGNDESLHEKIAEEYDNKKEIYNDNRIVYLGMDENLENIFFKYQDLFSPYMKVTDKNVEGLKRFLDDAHNFDKDSMKREEILKANSDRYDDEIIDFEIGIIFDDPNEKEEKDIIKFKSDVTSTKLDLLEKKIELMSGVTEEKVEEKKNVEDAEVVSLEDEVERNDAHTDVYVSDKLRDLNVEKVDFLEEEENKIASSIKKNRIDTSDDAIFKSNASSFEKTIKSIKDKLELKKRLELEALGKVVDVSRNYYDELIEKNELESDEEIDKIDMDVTNDIYELGIILLLKNKLDFETEMKKKKKGNDDPADDEAIKVLLDQIYQIGMQYKLFPGFCFNDTKEFDPEKVIAEIKSFDGKNYVPLELSELYRATTLHTFTIDDIKKKYEEMYHFDITKEEQTTEENEAVEM